MRRDHDNNVAGIVTARSVTPTNGATQIDARQAYEGRSLR